MATCGSISMVMLDLRRAEEKALAVRGRFLASRSGEFAGKAGKSRHRPRENRKRAATALSPSQFHDDPATFLRSY